jgi:Zn-dependent protease
MSTGRLPAIVFAICVHEASHAWMALRCGDDTAARMGRITLNPLAHLDPLGALCIAFFYFGWGRPVPFVERNLQNPRRDAMLIAAAGPASNLVMAAVFGVLFRLSFYLAQHVNFQSEAVGRIVFFIVFLTAWSVFINLLLCFFNLIPLFPLDGEKILMGLLPYQQASAFSQFRQYGPMALILLIFVGGPILSGFIFAMGTPFAWLFAGLSLKEVLLVIHVVFGALW